MSHVATSPRSFLCLASIVLIASADASTARAQDPAAVGWACAAANLVVIAHVDAVHSQLMANGAIWSAVDLTFERVVHGPPRAGTRMNIEGGKVGTLTYRVSGNPDFKEGDRWLLGMNEGPERPLRLVEGIVLELDPEPTLPQPPELASMWEGICDAQ